MMVNMWKKVFLRMLAITLLLGASAEEPVWMPSPWVESAPGELKENIGVEFGVPEGAKNVIWLMDEGLGLAEMRFTWCFVDYTARIQPAAEFTDISGLCYEGWQESDCTVGWCEGKIKCISREYGNVQVCLWYDAAPGLMYSVAATLPETELVDILAVAERVYLPAQGEVSGDETEVHSLP